MRALTGPSRGRTSSGRGYGSLPGVGSLPQPRLWVIPALAVPVLLAGAWLVDRVSAVWCDVAGGTPTTYAPSLLHLLVMVAVTLCGLVLATVVALAGHRRGWWVWLAWRAAYGLAWLLSRPVQAWHRHRARTVVPAAPVTVTASVPTAQVRADRPDVIDVDVLIDGVWTPADRVGERVR